MPQCVKTNGMYIFEVQTPDGKKVLTAENRESIESKLDIISINCHGPYLSQDSYKVVRECILH